MTSALLPVTDRERQVLEPVKRKVQEQVAAVGEQVTQKLQGDEPSEPQGEQALPTLSDLESRVH